MAEFPGKYEDPDGVFMVAKLNGETFFVAASATPAIPKKLVAVGAKVPAKNVAALALVDIPRKSRLDIFFITALPSYQ